MARRKVKNGEKRPWEQRLTRPVPNGRRRSDFWLVPENFCVFLPNQKAERRRPFGTGLVRHCPQGLFWPFFTFLRAIFFHLFRLSLAPLSAPGSPRMYSIDLIVVSEAILKQPLDKLQCFYGNLMSDNFRKAAVQKKKGIVKLSFKAKDCTNN